MEPKNTKELVSETRSYLKSTVNSCIDEFHNDRPQQAAKALQGFYQFEKDTLSHFDSTPQQINNIKQAYPHAFSGLDKQGRPVYIELIGSIKVNDLFKVIEDQTLVSYFVQKMSYLYCNIFPKTQKKDLLVVIDLKGQLTKLVSKRTFKIVNQILTVGQNFYPQTLYKMIFVNTPMTFQSTWSSIKGEIEPLTLNKIEFLGSDYEEELHRLIDRKYLPECLGGTVPDKQFSKGRGPWINNSEPQSKAKQQEDEEEESDDDNGIDFSALKAALSNVVPKEHQVRKDVASTPLNTQADDYS